MVQITDTHLAFMHEAREAFASNDLLETYMNPGDFEYIALRMGMDRDCVQVYELGSEIANFVQQIKPSPRPGNDVMRFAHRMETVLNYYPDLMNKEQAYIYGSLQNIMDSLHEELRNHHFNHGERMNNMCANLAAQAMLLAKAVERL